VSADAYAFSGPRCLRTQWRKFYQNSVCTVFDSEDGQRFSRSNGQVRETAKLALHIALAT